MNRLHRSIGALAAAAALSASLPAQALDIQVTLASAGQVSPIGGFQFGNAGTLVGGGNLASVLQAAVGTWESLLQDHRVFHITVGWVGMATTTLAAALPGTEANNVIVVNRNISSFFADPTPQDSSEFGGYSETFADLGGGLVNTGRGYATGRTLDLYTTLLHEIGHVLADAGDGPHVPNAPSYTVASGPFAGTTYACVGSECSHFSGLPGALMGTTGGAPGYRRTLVSGADLLYVASNGGFTQFDPAQVGPVPEPGTAALLAAGLATLAWRRRGRG